MFLSVKLFCGEYVPPNVDIFGVIIFELVTIAMVVIVDVEN